MRKSWWKYVLLVLVLLFFWFFRAWFQPPLMLFYTHPAILQGIVLWGLLHYFWFRKIKKEKVFHATGQDGKKHEMRFRFRHLSYLVLVLIVVLASMGSTISRQVHIVQEFDYTFRDSLPEAAEEIRLMPYEVAKRYARDSLQLSQYRLGTENIAIIDDKLSWMFPLVPDGLIIKFTLKNKGITYVDATTQDRNSKMVWQDMEIGQGMQITDNLWWNLRRVRYFVQTDDPYYLVQGNDIYTIVPAINYSWHFRWGFLYAVPRFAGPFLVNSSGDIELLSPEAALEHPVLAGNLIFPERLARTYVSAYQYINGVLNRFFMHVDQIQIQDVSRENRQPFLMQTHEGLKWFLSTEPYGASHGVFKIFMADARTGELELFELPQDRVLTGPVRAMDYVRRSNPVVDWSRFIMSEPLPFVRDGILYWKVAIIPDDGAGIAYQAFVDSRTNEVVELQTDREIALFVEGLEPIDKDDAPALEGLRLLQTIKEKIAELQDMLQLLEEQWLEENN